MSLYFDHVVLNVGDLDNACKDFEKAGFKVIPGGVHGGGLSRNALIFFKDDSFIELFALTGSWKFAIIKLFQKLKFLRRYQYSKKWGLAYRFYSRAMELKPGIADICFLSDDYKSDYDRIHGDGIFLTKSMLARRIKPGSGTVKWEMASPFINELPFFRSAYSPPRELQPEDVVHPNSVTGINKVTVVVLDYKDMTSKYETFLGQPPNVISAKEGNRNRFGLKKTEIDLVKASDEKTLQEQLRGKGIGMYGISFSSHEKLKEPFLAENLHGLTVI